MGAAEGAWGGDGAGGGDEAGRDEEPNVSVSEEGAEEPSTVI